MSGQSEAKCPLCGKPVVETRLAPFCGRRCADIDLGRWLKGDYAIPGAPAEDAPERGPGDDQAPEND